jgi:hypothetical protein
VHALYAKAAETHQVAANHYQVLIKNPVSYEAGFFIGATTHPVDIQRFVPVKAGLLQMPSHEWRRLITKVNGSIVESLKTF